MHAALLTLASVLQQPGSPDAEPALAALRSRWASFAPEERDALTPLARLAAARVRAAQAAAAAGATAAGSTASELDYLADLAPGDDDDEDP